jgi:hypothetical protein
VYMDVKARATYCISLTRIIIVIGLQPSVGLWLLFQILDPTQQVGPLGGWVSLWQSRWPHTQDNRNKESAQKPCLEWNSNPRPQCLSEYQSCHFDRHVTELEARNMNQSITVWNSLDRYPYFTHQFSFFTRRLT